MRAGSGYAQKWSNCKTVPYHRAPQSALWKSEMSRALNPYLQQLNYALDIAKSKLMNFVTCHNLRFFLFLKFMLFEIPNTKKEI